MKIICVSNCQALPICDALSFIVRGATFHAHGIHVVPPKDRESLTAKILEDTKGEDCILLSIPLAETFGGLSKDNITDSFPDIPVLKIPNLYFDGLHPDVTYMGALGSRVRGPLGDYHSKISLAAFEKGLSVSDTIALYNGTTYEAAGYFDQYQVSLDELSKREHSTDLKFTKRLAKILPEHPCFFTVNHPTSFLFHEFSKFVGSFLKDTFNVSVTEAPYSHAYFPNNLSSGSIFPIFPELAEVHALRYTGNYTFKGGAACPVQHPISLGEFITGEFESFAKVDRQAISDAPQTHAALKILEDVIG